MALSPSNPETFMQEVDDAVRADRLQSFVRNYGRWLIGLVIVGLIAFAGWLWWQSHSESVAGETGRNFSQALDTMGQGRTKAAAAQVEPMVKGDSATYRALALMIQGNSAVAANDVRGAAGKFGAVANDSAIDPALRNVALIRQTLIEFDLLAPAAVIARLRHLVATPGPAFASAAELTALAEMKRGNDRAAGLLYKRITEAPGVPDSLKSRAVQMAGLLGVDAIASRDAAPAAASANTRAPAAPTTANAAPAAAPVAAPAAATKTGE